MAKNKFIYIWLCGLLLSLLSALSLAKSSVYQEREAANLTVSKQSVARGSLWSFSKNGQTHYLFGTIHVGKAEYFPFDATLNNALAQSDALVVETDITDSKQLLTLKRKDPKQTWQALPFSTRQPLLKLANSLGLSNSVAENFSPVMILTMQALKLFLSLGLSIENGVDAYLSTQAKLWHKKVLSLESAQAQLDLLENIPVNILSSWLKQLSDPKTLQTKIVPESQRLIHDWETGDLNGLYALIEPKKDEAAYDQYFREVFAENRNVTMAEGIEMYAKTQKIFVAVGALHLVGPNSLLVQLKQRGFDLNLVLRK